MTPVTPDEFRRCFPGIDDRIHLASCSLGARSSALDAALARMLDDMRTFGAPWELFLAEADRARAAFATLIGTTPDHVALVPDASTGAFQAACAMEFTPGRPRIVVSDREFPSLAHVWLAQRPRGAAVVPTSDPAGATDERTALVSVPLTAYLSGHVLALDTVAVAARAAGARLFVDAYQSAGVTPIDVAALDCDFLVAGTSKYLLGLPGLAFLYVRDPAAPAPDPLLTGWFGRTDPFAFDPTHLDFPPTARRFETGTPPVPALYAGAAGLDLLSGLDPAAVHAHATALVARATELLAQDGLEVVTPVPPDRPGAHVAVRHPAPAALAARLAERGVTTSPRGDVLRLAFHFHTTPAEVDTACRLVALTSTALQRSG